MSKKLSYTLFTEKYRPENVNGMLLPDSYKKFFLALVKDEEIPNLLLFSSTPGSGKTSIAKAICNEIDADYLYINISSESGIDTLRTDIARFASGKNISGKKKIVIMDECLEENEKVRIGTTDSYSSIALKDMIIGDMYDMPSFNMDTGCYENDSGMIISDQEKEVFEVELEDGRTVIVTEDHPFIVNESGINIQMCIKDGLIGKDVVVKEI